MSMYGSRRPGTPYLFKLFLAKFVLAFLGFEEAVELFLLLTLNMLLELLLIIVKGFCLMKKYTS